MPLEKVLNKTEILRTQKEIEESVTNAALVLNSYNKEMRWSNSVISDHKAAITRLELDYRLRNTPISELSKYRSGVPVNELENAGYFNVHQLLGLPAKRLTAYKGVGKVKASNAVSAVEQLRADIASRTSMPLYEELHADDFDFLRALYAKKQLGNFRLNQNELTEKFSDIKSHLVQAKRSTRWPRLWLGGKRALRKASDIHIRLAARMSDFSRESELPYLAEAVEAAGIPRSFKFLMSQYLENAAEYAAFFYSDEERNIKRRVTQNRLGLPPLELAQEIDSLILNIAGLNITLRGYQEFGIKYLVSQRRTVLGDEMGLGKTIQALGAFVHLHNTISATHCLVVAPAGLVPNWEKEILSRTAFQAWKLHGIDRDQMLRQWVQDGGIAVVSYATLRNMSFPDELYPDVVIGDEAHFVKNPNAKRTMAFREIANRAAYVSLLSGTPMENAPEEFVSVMASLGMDDTTGKIVNAQPKRALSKGPESFMHAVAPIYLRRNQDDVLHELPDKLELLEWVEQKPEERDKYLSAVSYSHVMQIRQATTTGIVNSAKMERLKELLEYYMREQRKVVVFSFFHSALDAVGNIYPQHYRIDGQQGAQNRVGLIEEFSAKPGFGLLLSQIDAGGVGLNIQAASVVILMEPQLKPTTEWQAIARVHRMGQARRVVVHRLLAVDTIDERLLQRLNQKSASFDEYARISEIKDSISTATAQGTLDEQNIITSAELVAMERAALHMSSNPG